MYVFNMGAHRRSMTSPGFTELVSRLIEGMGQQLSGVRPTTEGFLLKTGDGFLYAFLEDPTQVSLAVVQKLIAEVGSTPMKLAILTPGHFPLALTQAVIAGHGAVVDGARFAELVRGLGLETYLGEEPRPGPPVRSRLLPSAQQLDAVMRRARGWLDWGVPALALRFYRQAVAMKPEFAPARSGVGRALLALGLIDDADRSFSEVLASNPDDLEARLGAASVLGARGRTEEEVRAYRKILDAEPSHVEVRAHLVAALIAEGKWSDARHEIETMLTATPEDPQIRFLHAASLWKTGATSEGDAERGKARTLGLTWERERALCEHLGLPLPEPPSAAPSSTAAPAPPTENRALAKAKPARASKRAAAAPRKSAVRKRK